jgi:hypothetical protein
MPCQILALHTFIAVLWGIGMRARGIAFGLVGLTWVFIVLWVVIGNAINKNYEVPTPVSYFDHYLFTSFLTTDTVCIVLVLDQSSIYRTTPGRGVHLVMDSIICISVDVYPTAFMGGGSLVDWR